jgi:hypothetical protein
MRPDLFLLDKITTPLRFKLCVYILYIIIYILHKIMHIIHTFYNLHIYALKLKLSQNALFQNRN